MTTEQTLEKEKYKKQARDERPSATRCSGQDHRVEAAQEHSHDRGTPTPNADLVGYRTHLSQLRRDAPCRPRDWRQQLAVEITRHPDPRVVARLRRWADDWVEKLLEHDKHHPDAEHALAQARDLVKPARMRQRIEVQARLLAGQSSTAIANKTGLTSLAIDWYEAAYFCCRDRLVARGYIVHQLLGSVLPIGTGTSPPWGLLAWYGLFLGPTVVDLILDVFHCWDADRQPSRGLTAAQLLQRARRLTARASVQARLLPIATLGHADLRTLLAMAEQGNRNQVIR